MAAVILVLAEDIGDMHRAPFVNSVVRAIDALTSQHDAKTSVSTTASASSASAAPAAAGGAPDVPMVIGSPSRLPGRGGWGGRENADTTASSPGTGEQGQGGTSEDIYLLVAGSKRHASHLNLHDTTPPNLAVGGSLERQTSRADWDRAWTSGEQIFGDIINGVGIERFGFRTNLWAQLIDVGSGQGIEDVAVEVEHALTRRWCDGVCRVYMLVPRPSALGEQQSVAGESSSEEHHEQLVQDMDLRRVKAVFEGVWGREGSILRKAKVEFVTSSGKNR